MLSAVFEQAAGTPAMSLSKIQRHRTIPVRVGKVQVGGDAPIVVQSMTNTDTADVDATTRQVRELAEAGSEIVRLTVNVAEAAAAVPEIRRRLGLGRVESASQPTMGALLARKQSVARELAGTDDEPEPTLTRAEPRREPEGLGQVEHDPVAIDAAVAVHHRNLSL